MLCALALPGAALVTVALVLLCAPLARRIGLLDLPGGHRSHAAPVPLVGGVAMFCGFMFGVLLLDESLHAWRALFAASALLVITGVLDDFRELEPSARFAAQILAALMMAFWGGVQLHDLGDLVGPTLVALGTFGPALTVFAVVGVINAFNMSDGADGLAGGIALGALGWLALAALLADSPALPLLLVLGAVTAAFLGFNLRYPGHPRASIFMGDAGSMFLGFTLAWFLVALSQGPARVIAPVSALWLVALPLFDTVCIMLRRLYRGRSPFLADRGHLHHLLGALGLPTGVAVAALLGASVLLGAVGLCAPLLGVSEHVLFFVFAALFVLFCVGMELGWRWVDQRPGSGV